MRRSSWLAPILLTFIYVSPVQAADGVERRVPAGGNLQQALNDAQSGDRVILEPGATYIGNFVLPVHGGSDFVTVTTDPASSDLPAAGGRMAANNAGLLAKIQSPGGDAALRTAPGAHHWRLQLLEFPGARSSDIILLGDGSQAQRALSDVPRDLIIDRCYIHGDSSVANGSKRGVALNSGRTSITGSTIADIARPGQDTQAIGGWNGPGPYLIENNRLEAAAENVMFGGARPWIPDLVPSDITIRRNIFTKPLAWRDRTLNVKNLFELKNARRVLVEFNVFEYNWASAQSGYAIVLTPRGEAGSAPWATVEDVTFRNNIIRHSGSGINVLGRDDTGPSGRLRGLRISNNLFYDIDDRVWGGSGAFLQIGNGSTDVVVEHNTIWHSGNVLSAYGDPRNTDDMIRGFTFRDNLARHNKYGVHASGRAVGNDTLETFFPRVVFANNVLAGGKASIYPADNLFPSIEDFERQFVDPSKEDYRLVENSMFHDKGSDGTDLGADVARIFSGVPEDDARRSDRERRPVRKEPGGFSVGAALAVASFTLARALIRP